MLENGQLPPYQGVEIGPVKAQYLGELWYTHFDPAWGGDGGPGGFTDEQKRGANAFQLSIRDIIYEYDVLPASPLDWDVTSNQSGGDNAWYFRAAGDSFEFLVFSPQDKF